MTRRALVYLLGLVALAVSVAASWVPVQRWLQNYFATPDSLLEKTAWNWVQSEASLDWSLSNYKGPFTVTVENRNWLRKIIKFAREDDVLLSWEADPTGAFVDVGHNTIVYAAYSDHSAGCRLVAFDLSARKELWRNWLRAAGIVEHSKYSNQVILRRTHPRYLTVLGKESAARYIEIVDIKTGKTVAHRTVERSFGEDISAELIAR
jgi:hypothetical protein